MKKYSERTHKRDDSFFMCEIAKRTRPKIKSATMLAGLLLVSFSSCRRDMDSPKYDGESKISTTSVSSASAAISSNFFGINAWMHSTPCNASGELSNLWPKVTKSGAKFIRVGGTGYDKCLTDEANNSDFTNSGIISEISAKPGLTPIVQLSYYEPGTNQVYTNPGIVPAPGYPTVIPAGDAATHLVNDVVIPLYAQGVRYFSIGNEPDKVTGDYYGTTNIYAHDQGTAAGIFDYISAISSAIRNLSVQYPGQYTDIKLLGPELTKFDESLINDLTSGSYDICPYIDYFTVHYYPFGDEGDIGNPGFPDATDKNIVNLLKADAPAVYKRNNGERVKSLELKLTRLKEKISASSNPDVGMALTETNLGYENYDDDVGTDGISYPDPLGNNIHVFGTNSYRAGQFWAEMMAVCMSKRVDFITFWSVKEGGDVPYNTNIGYINSFNDNKNSTYYHFQMLANNFSGKFKWGTITTDAALSPKPRIKAFASNNETKITIMIMNQDQDPNTKIKVRVRLDNTVAVPAGGVCINISDAIGINNNPIWDKQMPGQSTLLLQYDIASGTLTKVLKYTSVDNFNNIAPH